MAVSLPSGRGRPGQTLKQLDPSPMWDLRSIVKQRAKMGEHEFEGIWAKCLKSIGKNCQNLRSGILKRRYW